jgi:flagellin-like protein
MKGISSIIATILVLVITVGIAGVAWGFMSGFFTSRTAVQILITDAECSASGGITAWVTNDGSQDATGVTVDLVGTANSCAPNGGTIASAATESCVIPGGSPGAGYHQIRASGSGSSSRGSVYCPG